MANGLYQIGTSRLAQRFGHGFSFITVTCIQSDLDQFMVIQRQFDLLKDSRAETVLASQYNGFQGMGFSPQKLLQFRFQLVFLSAIG